MQKIMKYRKFFCFLLACSVLSTVVPATAFARTNSTQAVKTEDYSNQDGKKECQIEAEMALYEDAFYMDAILNNENGGIIKR